MAETKEDRTEAATRYLDEQQVAYEVVEHPERFTAAGEARAAGIEPADAAKDILLRTDGSYILAVIPASERLDIRKVRDRLSAEGEIRLATEDEIAADFSGFELGALPPFGPVLGGAAQIVDRRLLDHERVLCNGGDHRHSLMVDPNEIVRVTEARVEDICQDE
ncbi:MAG: aminoacyl-tRNA deacylase [Solirubrobacterales bacterium]